ncbi:MAG: putative maltokinase, partial [Deltaproteobacteria bacterium]|nr:putative maltokinase [Deltaproteobacteria bacterium]
HQPDLNFENPAVHEAVFDALDFWLEAGVDGLRLDAIPYLFEREGTMSENLPETHDFLKELRARVDAKYEDRMLLAEANQWPEDARAYFGDGDECHMAFHFPLMPRIFMATRMESRFPIVEILAQTPEIPDNSQWAIFLRNHDELTLEMVTDEERDYMYRVYANDPKARINLGIRRRLAPLLSNDRRKIELLTALLLSLPGTPVIYYGDEIGMGDNIYLGDRNGVRTPMQWSVDRNAGFSMANPQSLFLPVIIDPEYHYEALNVEGQEKNLSSLLWWTRRVIATRKQYAAFGQGKMEILHPDNHKVLAFIRRDGEEIILVVANLSRFSQCVQLDLSPFNGMVPVELFGHTHFPGISKELYPITVGPHGYFWFVLERPKAGAAALAAAEWKPPVLEISDRWADLLGEDAKDRLERGLPGYLRTCRWFGAKARVVRKAELIEVIPVSPDTRLTFVRVLFVDGEPETYVLPLAHAAGEAAGRIRKAHPRAVVAETRSPKGKGVLYDALYSPDFCNLLLDVIERRRQLRGETGRVTARPTKALRQIMEGADKTQPPALLGAEQSNTSVLFQERAILKIFRRVEAGVNPDLEIGRFLTEKTTFTSMPPVGGFLEYAAGREAPMTLGFVQGYVPNEGDAWRYTLDELGRYFERALEHRSDEQRPDTRARALLSLTSEEVPPLANEIMGGYLDSARLLGQRTAELHIALASSTSVPDFAVEPITPFYQRSMYQTMRGQASQAFRLLRKSAAGLKDGIRQQGELLIERETEVLDRFERVLEKRINACRTRVHGDYHLGQVLFTGKDFVIIDFEGEPARSLSERRLKRSPLRDVAGMLRSFHYAACTALFHQTEGAGAVRDLLGPQAQAVLLPWARFWNDWVCTAYLKTYLDTADGHPFLPKTREGLGVLLDAFLLEKAVYELGYELNNRPDWVFIPIQGILQILDSPLSAE